MTSLAQTVKAAVSRFLDKSLAEEIVILYSGGRDSTVLLEILSNIKCHLDVAVRAIHINYNLTPGSAEQADRCELFAKKKNVDLRVHNVLQVPPKGQSIEEWARNIRYDIAGQSSCYRSLVITGHHLNDQTETVIQRFLTGAGPYGLRGIVPLRRLGSGFLGRPLLTISRQEITTYAESRNLSWYEDPMNDNLRYERNEVRKVILPKLESISKGLVSRLESLSKIQREIAEILDSLADSHLLSERNLPKSLSI